MLRTTVVAVTLLAACICTSRVATANPVVDDQGALVERFDDGKLDAYRLTTFRGGDVPKAAVVTRDGERMLNLNEDQFGWTTAWIKDRTFKDFTAEVTVKKPNARQGFAGLSFRNRVKVFFKQFGRVQITNEGKGSHSLGQSIDGFDIEKFRRLKLVCVGPVIRVSVDGKVVLEVYDPDLDQEGPIGLTTHSTNAYFDDLVISPNVAPEDAVIVEPTSESNALVFAPDRATKLHLRIGNFSKAALPITSRASVVTWGGATLRKLPPQTTSVAGGKDEVVAVDLPATPEGYYQLVVDAECNGHALAEKRYPFAVHELPHVTYEAPIIPIAPYWAYQVANMAPLSKNTYMHAAAHSLRRHGFNAIVGAIDIDKAQVDILREYGIAVITRGTKCIEEPSVIGGLIGDEPREDDIENYKKQYAELTAKTDKPLTTCMIGESILHAIRFWEILQPKVRAFRWYGLKKNFYNVRHRLVYKDVLSFVDTLVLADTCAKTPWWIILPAFGGTDLGAYYCNPSPPEITAMMHLSLAYGADGLLFYILHPYNDRNIAMVDGPSLQPQDGKYEAMAKVNHDVNAHAALIKSLKLRGLDVRCDSDAIEAVGLDSAKPDDEEKASAGRVNNQYIYVINKDNAETVTCRVFNLDPEAEVTSVFTGEKLTCAKETVQLRPGVTYGTGVVRMTLKPGEGQLLKHHQEWVQPPAVVYPASVANVPEAQTVWLMALTPTNTPMPGWLPKKPGSWKFKTWAEMNGPTTLYHNAYNPLGSRFERSLYAQSETIIDYDLPAGCSKLVAVIGLGNRNEASSVVFKVFVDDKEQYNSGIYRCGMAPTPIVVDVKGGKKLKLVVTDGGDGISQDYAWWGDARLIKE